MIEVEFVVLVPGGDQDTVGFAELEVIPRADECVFYDRNGDERDTVFKVKEVIHKVVPKGPPIVMMRSVEDESRIK
jgi:hypothetical protein